VSGSIQPPFVAPSILRRIASMLYEAVLLSAVAFFANSAFFLASGGSDATAWQRALHQIYLGAVFAAYFLWCWLRSGQTLAMKTWRIRLVAPGHSRLPPRIAFIRLLLAAILIGSFWASVVAAFVNPNPWLSLAMLAVTGIGIGWALFDRDGQFLHDRLAGTRLIAVD
jgi:uncharacterized RDD family membrane protein YckC